MKDYEVKNVKSAVHFRFRLYVAGDIENSAHADANLRALCRTYLPYRHEIEVVNVFQSPQRALADGIFMTPMLIKLDPAPVRRIVVTLSRSRLVLHALGLDAPSS